MTTRENTKKAQVVEFVKANPGLNRKQYMEAFVNNFGTSASTASLYHHLYVTRVKKEEKMGPQLSTKHPRDSRGRFVKRS